jgi:hypothetical protein
MNALSAERRATAQVSPRTVKQISDRGATA